MPGVTYCGSMTTLSQHHHHLLPKNNSHFPLLSLLPIHTSNWELYWFMNASASTGSRIREAEVGVKGWKLLWHCHPKWNSSAFKKIHVTFFPTLHIDLAAHRSDSSCQNGACHPSAKPQGLLSRLSFTACNTSFWPCSSWKGLLCGHINTILTTAQQPEGKKTHHVTAQLRIVLRTVFFCTCLDGQMKALQISFSSCTTKLLGVCLHTFLFCFSFSFVIELCIHRISSSIVQDYWCSYSWLNGCALHLTVCLKASENLLPDISLWIINGNCACKNGGRNLMLEYIWKANRL